MIKYLPVIIQLSMPTAEFMQINKYEENIKYDKIENYQKFYKNDAKFPSTTEELIQQQNQKIIDNIFKKEMEKNNE